MRRTIANQRGTERPALQGRREFDEAEELHLPRRIPPRPPGSRPGQHRLQLAMQLCGGPSGLSDRGLSRGAPGHRGGPPDDPRRAHARGEWSAAWPEA